MTLSHPSNWGRTPLTEKVRTFEKISTCLGGIAKKWIWATLGLVWNEWDTILPPIIFEMSNLMFWQWYKWSVILIRFKSALKLEVGFCYRVLLYGEFKTIVMNNINQMKTQCGSRFWNGKKNLKGFQDCHENALMVRLHDPVFCILCTGKLRPCMVTGNFSCKF